MLGKIEIKRLQEKEVTIRVLADINNLLRKQHPDAETLTHEELLERLRTIPVAVAWNDNERIVGMAALVTVTGLNYACREIRHLVIAEGLDVLSVGIRLIEKLMEVPSYGIEYYEGGVWIQDSAMREIFVALDFREKPMSRYRLRITGKK